MELIRTIATEHGGVSFLPVSVNAAGREMTSGLKLNASGVVKKQRTRFRPDETNRRERGCASA